MDRRTAIRWLLSLPLGASAATAGLRAVCAMGPDEELPSLNWPNRVFQTPIEKDDDRPPVVTAVDVHPVEPLLAAAGDDHHVYLWRLDDGRLVRRLEGHVDWVHTVAFSPGGKALATAGNDRRVVFWDSASGERLYLFDDHRHTVTRLAWRHDGARIAGTGFEDRLRIYDVESRALVSELTCPSHDMRVVDYSADDRWLAAGGRDGVVRLWEAATGRHLLDYRAHRQRIRGLAFSPDNKFLATSGEDRMVHVHGVEHDDEGFDLPRAGAKVLSLAFTGPHHLATGCSDNLIRVWDLKKLKLTGVLRGHQGSVASLAYRHETLVSGSYDTTVRAWSHAEAVAEQGPTPTRTTRRK